MASSGPMKEPLTRPQEEVYLFIQKEILEGGAPPTYRAIAKHFGYKSNRAAQDHVATLVRKGYLIHKPGQARGLRLPGQVGKTVPLAVPIMGAIAAGTPRASWQVQLGQLPFPRELVKGEAEIFAVRVTGDSMIDAGIHEGDMVIARVQKTASHGDIVVALVNGDSTVKRLYKKDGRLVLVPENAKMKPLHIPPEEIEIQGKVIGLQRYYR